MNRVDNYGAFSELTEINLSLTNGGMGDQVCRLPAIKALLTLHPHIEVHAYAPTHWVEVLNYFFGKYPRFIAEVRDHNVDNYKARPGYYFIGVGEKRHMHTTLGCHLVDYAYHILLDRQPEIEERNYLSVQCKVNSKGGKYAVLTPGFTSKTRALPAPVWNEIATYIATLGITPLWLGKKRLYGNNETKFEDGIDYSIGQDMRDKTTVLEAAMIMSQAQFVIGLDNGLLHVAGMTDVPIIAGYSSVKPKYRMPIRHGELGWNVHVVNPVSCFGCENIVRFDYNQDFRECRYGDYVCTKELTFDKWREKIDLVVGATKHDGSTI